MKKFPWGKECLPMPLLPVTAKLSYRRVDIQLYDWYWTSFEYFGEICENEGLCICECGRHLLSSSTFMLQKAVAALKHFESSTTIQSRVEPTSLNTEKLGLSSLLKSSKMPTGVLFFLCIEHDMKIVEHERKLQRREGGCCVAKKHAHVQAHMHMPRHIW